VLILTEKSAENCKWLLRSAESIFMFELIRHQHSSSKDGSQHVEPGCSCCWLCCDDLCLQCVYELVQQGANLDAANRIGETALHVMIRRNKFDCVLGLLAKGTSTAVKGVNSDNALHMAVEVVCCVTRLRNLNESLDPFPFVGGCWTKKRPGLRLICR